MSSGLVIEAADTTGRWYLLPGGHNSFELRVENPSEHAVLCKLSLDEPENAGSVAPATLTLKAGEARSITISFKPDWLTLRDRKTVVTARDAGNAVLATFVRDLVAATSTDCSVSLAWKDEISADGMLRGFVLSCAVRSISTSPGIFEPEFTAHPALSFPEQRRIALGPGESTTFDVPVVWNRSARDNEGWNHPRTIDVGVAVTHGRRTASAPWDLVQQHLEPYLTDADRAPVIARRPPPPQFSAPGGGPGHAPSVSPLAVEATLQEPSMSPTITGTHAERIARAEMEAGVAVGGMRLPPPPPDAPMRAPGPQTVSVAPSTLMLIGLAIGAIAIVFVWMLRSPVGPGGVSTEPVAVVNSPAMPALRAQIRKPKPKPHATHAATAASAPSASTSSSESGSSSSGASAGSAPPASAAVAPAPSRASGGAPAQRVSPVDRGALVQLNDVGAEYLRGGRVVHVYWDSYAQAHAQVQLLDSHSVVVAQTDVGRRMAAVLSLPRGYRDSVYVQVTAIGYDGVRVVGSTSLSPP